MDGWSRPEIHSGWTVDVSTEEEAYFTLVTAEAMGRKYVPPKEPARRTSSGVRFGWKSSSADWMASSSPQGKVNSPVVLLRFGLGASDSSMKMCAGGKAGGSLYISFI